MNVTLTELGLPRQDPPTLWSYVGHGVRVTLERALGAEHAPLLDRAVGIFMPWYGEHLLDRSAVYPGLAEVIEALAARGVVFSVLTNKLAALSDAIVSGLGLGERFPRLIGGDSLPVKKPDPTGLRTLIDEAGLPAASTLMVGDSGIDVATGRNAGVATCGVLWGFSGRAVESAGADVLISTPAELERVCLDGIPRRHS